MYKYRLKAMVYLIISDKSYSSIQTAMWQSFESVTTPLCQIGYLYKQDYNLLQYETLVTYIIIYYT
jgi:hypothetical protein